MRQWVVLIPLFFLPVTALAGEPFLQSTGLHDQVADRWLKNQESDECRDPNYQHLIPIFFSPATKFLLLLPNLFGQEMTLGVLDPKLPDIFIAALPDGCDHLDREKKNADEALKRAALEFVVDSTVGTILERVKEYLPDGLKVDLDIDPGDRKLAVRAKFVF